jgi:hypothetical protein
MATRSFDGIDDRLDTGVSQTKGSTNNVSIYAWIKTTDLDAGMKDLMGLINAFDADQRLQFRQSYSSSAGSYFMVLEHWGMGIPNQRFCSILMPGDPRGNCAFCAYVNDVAADRARFFWGLTANTIAEVSTDDFFIAGFGSAPITACEYKQVALPSCTINLAAMGREGGAAQNFWFGKLSGLGLAFDSALTIDDLKLRAQNGTGAAEAGEYYWPINGDTPEPGIETIYGTTVVDDIRCGSEEPPVVSAGAQLITCM